MKVILIDDEPFALKLLTQQLRQLGYEHVISFERVDDALAVLEAGTEQIDLIFCDLQMPEKDGVELVRDLAKVGYTGGFVLVSGEDGRILKSVTSLARAHKINILDALHKPVTADQLRLVLERNAARGSAAPRSTHKTYLPDDLRRAIDSGELVNYYQPKVNLMSGAVTGVESLVRWQHPRDGLVYPDQFVAIAEQHGFIDDLTHAVLCDALRQVRLWKDSGLDLQVAVNISMDNLASLEFPDLVSDTAGAQAVPVSSLVLEVTESRLMTDRRASLDILTRLRLKRISLSIDDFGTGHSSLAQLRDIPFDELKIDRSFTHGACRDASLRAIFEACLGMAQQLGMTTVAEGVEDGNDWDYLRTCGCEMAQGYFIAKPMPATLLPAWMVDWATRRPALGVAVNQLS